MGFLSRSPSFLTVSSKLRRYLFPAPFASSFSSSSRDVPVSVAYRRSMLRPPSTVSTWKLPRNSCSFIGTVDGPVRCSREKRRILASFAFLEVKSDYRLQNSSSFHVTLWMQGNLARISLKHLKPNDFIYVSGALGLYTKFDDGEEPRTFYKVNVRHLNYVVKPMVGVQVASTSGSSFKEEMTGGSHENEHLARMHLWQVFFATPGEWWDNRTAKRHPGAPDFKHKATKECIWVSPDDPPWVRKQLELYDADLGGGRFGKYDANDDWDFKDF